MIEAGGLDAASVELVPWPTPVWRCGPVVLSSKAGLTSEALDWESALLDALGSTGFPAARSAKIFDGKDHLAYDGFSYVARTWIDGHILVSRPPVDLEAVGAFVAKFHDATSTIALAQRPGIPPLTEVLLSPDDAALLTALGEQSSVRRYRVTVDQLLDRVTDEPMEQPIHGDFTTRNIVVDAEHSAITGLIDFGMAFVSTPTVELAYGLPSARPTFDSIDFDLVRVDAIVRGYAGVRSLPPDCAPRIVAHAGCRPLLHIAIHAITGTPVRSSLALDRSEWIVNNGHAMTDAIASALTP